WAAAHPGPSKSTVASRLSASGWILEEVVMCFRLLAETFSSERIGITQLHTAHAWPGFHPQVVNVLKLDLVRVVNLVRGFCGQLMVFQARRIHLAIDLLAATRFISIPQPDISIR